MNNGGEAADQMVREALQVTEVAIKLSALGIKNALALSLAYAKENPKVKGKTSLDRLLREGKELKLLPCKAKTWDSLRNWPSSTAFYSRSSRIRHRTKKLTSCSKPKMSPN